MLLTLFPKKFSFFLCSYKDLIRFKSRGKGQHQIGGYRENVVNIKLVTWDLYNNDHKFTAFSPLPLFLLFPHRVAYLFFYYLPKWTLCNWLVSPSLIVIYLSRRSQKQVLSTSNWTSTLSLFSFECFLNTGFVCMWYSLKTKKGEYIWVWLML